MLPDEQGEILRVVLDDLSPPNHLLLSWLLEHMTHIIDKVSTISVFLSLFILPHCFYKLQKFVFSSFQNFSSLQSLVQKQSYVCIILILLKLCICVLYTYALLHFLFLFLFACVYSRQ